MNFLSSTFKLIWFFICFVGNMYQIGQISNQFFRYEIVTTVNLNFPDIFTAPAISVCFYEIEIVNWDRMESIKPNIKEDLNISQLSENEINEMRKKMLTSAKRKFQGDLFSGMDIKTRSQVSSTHDELFSDCLLVDVKDGTKST